MEKAAALPFEAEATTCIVRRSPASMAFSSGRYALTWVLSVALAMA